MKKLSKPAKQAAGQPQASMVLTTTYRLPGKFDRYSLMFTIFNCCIGSGLLAIPKITSTSGYLAAVVFDTVSLLFCYYTFLQIIEANYHGNYHNARDMARYMYGKAFGWAVDISILACIMPVTYTSIGADYIRFTIIELGHYKALESDMWRRVMKVIVAAGVIFPLTIPKSIRALNYISSAAVVFVIAAFVAINVRFVQWIMTRKLNGVDFNGMINTPPILPPDRSKLDGYKLTNSSVLDTLSYFTVFFTLYSLHASLTPIQHDIHGTPSERRKALRFAMLVTIPVVAVIYLIAAVEGSLMFLRECEPGTFGCINSNILLAFKSDVPMVIIMLLYSVVILTSYPVMLYPIRSNIMAWFRLDKDTKRGYAYFILIGFLLVVFCATLAILIADIDKVLSIMGNLFGIVIFELYPVFVVYKLPLLRERSVGAQIDRILARRRRLDNCAGAGAGSASELLAADDRLEETATAGSGSTNLSGSPLPRFQNGDDGAAAPVIEYAPLDVSTIKYHPSLTRRALFLFTTVVLVTFNTAATVCEVLIWTR